MRHIIHIVYVCVVCPHFNKDNKTCKLLNKVVDSNSIDKDCKLPRK